MFTWLEPADVAGIFSEEIAQAKGKITEKLIDEGRLFARSVLPKSLEVAPRDRLRGGVAVRATETDIFIHPYVFREVCSNGAIMTQAIQTRHISREYPEGYSDPETTLREAIRCCCVPEAFATSARHFRSAQQSYADLAINLAAYTHGRHGSFFKSHLQEILHQYDQAADQSTYSLVNAITSVARDTRDPQAKWDLEALGGTIAAQAGPPKHPQGGRKSARPMVEIG
jgi:hypothetical protein